MPSDFYRRLEEAATYGGCHLGEAGHWHIETFQCIADGHQLERHEPAPPRVQLRFQHGSNPEHSLLVGDDSEECVGLQLDRWVRAVHERS